MPMPQMDLQDREDYRAAIKALPRIAAALELIALSMTPIAADHLGRLTPEEQDLFLKSVGDDTP